MARPKAFEEEEALEAAAELFWRQGFDATSMCDLEAGMGMGRQSIYNAFGDKHALFVRALQHYTTKNKAEVTASLLAPGAGLQAIRRYFHYAVGRVAGAGPRKGCLVANSILEIGTGDDAVSHACVDNQEAVIAGLEHALSNAVSAGDLPKGLDVVGTARMLMAQVYGLTVLSKTGMSRADLTAAAERMLDQLV